MPPKKGGGGKQDPRKQFFNSIRDEKLDSLRWCLRHGGLSLRTEDEDGHTGIQLAAAGGKVDALSLLLEHMRKAGSQDDLEEADEEGRTPLMMAAYNGKMEIVLMLWRAKANLKAKDEKGKTARDYAVDRKHDKLVAFFDNPKVALGALRLALCLPSALPFARPSPRPLLALWLAL
jgi:ankyrin repeat protein